MGTLQIARFSLLLALRWIPRILGILYAVLICLFSFDVFGQQGGFLKTLAAFLIHNIPAIVLITILMLSWKWSWIGGISYIALGISYLIWFKSDNIYPIIYLPLFITGILFCLDWFLRKNIEEAQDVYRASDY